MFIHRVPMRPASSHQRPSQAQSHKRYQGPTEAIESYTTSPHQPAPQSQAELANVPEQTVDPSNQGTSSVIASE